MKINLNQVHSLLREVADPCVDESIDKDGLEMESREANSELARDIELLNEAYTQLSGSLKNGNVYDQKLALALLRGRAMGVETVFSNLARSVESVMLAVRGIEEQSKGSVK